MQHQKLNLGGTKATAETRNISKAMNITPAEETTLKDYVNRCGCNNSDGSRR